MTPTSSDVDGGNVIYLKYLFIIKTCRLQGWFSCIFIKDIIQIPVFCLFNTLRDVVQSSAHRVDNESVASIRNKAFKSLLKCRRCTECTIKWPRSFVSFKLCFTELSRIIARWLDLCQTLRMYIQGTSASKHCSAFLGKRKVNSSKQSSRKELIITHSYYLGHDLGSKANDIVYF